MILTVVLFALGLLLIILGGDKFVDAAVAIARRLGISELIIGATIVSLGTTLPEVLVSTTAALEGSADISAGNAFGSIICNTALIAGLTQLIRPTAGLDRRSFAWRTFFFFAASAVCLAFGLGMGRYGVAAGVILLCLFALYAYLNVTVKPESTESAEDGEAETQDKPESLVKSLLILVITAAMLFFGARLLVDNGILIARALNVPERVIGVTFIALGTSLPELVTAITSLVKGHGAVSVGNILGANLLNCVLVIGIPAVICGITPSAAVVRWDIPIAMGVMALLTVPIICRKKGSRLQGALLLACYAAYCVMQF